MSDAEYRRWESIIEHEALGEIVGEEDRAFRAEYEREHPECARETERWGQLLGMLGQEASAEGLDHADALAQRVLVQRDVEREVVRPLRATSPSAFDIRRVVAVAVAAAAAAAVAAFVLIGLDEEPAVAQATSFDASALAPVVQTPARAAPPAEAAGTPIGRLALAGEGVRIDGGVAMAGASVRPDQRLDFDATTPEEGAGACVVYHSPWITTCFARASELTFTETTDGLGVELRRGRVLVTLDALPAARSFSVTTSKGSIAASGSSFEVWIDEAGTVRASVLDGEVQVRDGGGPRALAAGQSTTMGSPAVNSFGADALAWSRAHVDAAQLWRARDAGLLVIRGRQGGERAASVSFDALSIGHVPLSMLAPAGEHLVAMGGSPRGTNIEIEEGMTRELELEAATEPARDPKSARSRPSVADLVWKASGALGAHRYQDAAKYLERLLREYPDGPDAQNARVQLGDLMLDKLGKPTRALTLYDAYLSRGGPLTPEARHGRVRTLDRLGRQRDERAAIELFLDKHPGDWRAKQLRVRLEAL